MFDTIAEAAQHAYFHRTISDQYFAVLSLKEPFIIDENKRKEQVAKGYTNATGKAWRTHSNMGYAKAFFFDIDVGPKKDYIDRASALAAFKSFLKKSGLPTPTFVNSGRGFHVYWILDRTITVAEWQSQAQKLKQICSHFAFKTDPTRLADSASVLRVPGTLHLKDPLNPIEVQVLKLAPVIEFDRFCSILDKAMKLTPDGEFYGSDDPPPNVTPPTPVTMKELLGACPQALHLVRNAKDASEPEWYKLLGVMRFVENGAHWAHETSKQHPSYEFDWIDKKLAQLARPLADGERLGPTTCGAMADTCGAERCQGCWYSSTKEWRSSSPLVAARRKPKEALEHLPEPPVPYSRVRDGILRGGDDAMIICPYDLYPVHRLHNPFEKKREAVWAIELPREGRVEFEVTTEQLNDGKLLCNVLGNAGFWPQYDEQKWVQQYMKAYMRELQKYTAEHHQHTHLGWYEGEFVLPYASIKDGKSRPVIVADNVRRAAESVRKAGTFEEQVRLLKFYDKPMYVRHQFMIGASLASTLFKLTGHNGTVVNLTGESGASKSTALYTAASLWGHPKRFTYNGNEDGGTRLHRLNRIEVLNNLPFCIDEITLMEPDEARALVMNFTQPGTRGRMGKDGKERSTVNQDDERSTLMLATSNKAIHELLTVRNAAGTAGAMRLFEVPCPKVYHADKPDHEAKFEAEQFLMALSQNHGHIGPRFIEWVTAHIDEVKRGLAAEQRRLDHLAEFRQAERFWSAVVATTIYALKLAAKLDLLPFDANAVELWALSQQIGEMRETVTSSYGGPIDDLMSYLAASANNLIITNGVTAGGNVNFVKGPQGALAGSYDQQSGRAVVVMAHLRSYAARERVQLNALLSHLEGNGIGSRKRRNPGAGTMYAIGQQNCIEIETRHEAISGHAKLKDMDNVVPLRA